MKSFKFASKFVGKKVSSRFFIARRGADDRMSVAPFAEWSDYGEADPLLTAMRRRIFRPNASTIATLF